MKTISTAILVVFVVLRSCLSFTLSSIPRLPSRTHFFESVANFEQEAPLKDQVLQLLSTTPTNAPTSMLLTYKILDKISELEKMCPTRDEDVLASLAGSWELVWTAQDRRRRQFFRSFINPLENQAYSNNPDGDASGRANPFLPRRLQERLERLGVIQSVDSSTRSTQTIMVEKGQVRNVVAFQIPAPRRDEKARRASLTVDIRFKPNPQDSRRVDVKFESCRINIPQNRVNIKFPLGPFGPTGWLRTGYIDDTIRITRGHKGSVFVLTRLGSKRSAELDLDS